MKLRDMEAITKLFLTVMRKARVIISKLAFNSTGGIISPSNNHYFQTTDHIFHKSPFLIYSRAIFYISQNQLFFEAFNQLVIDPIETRT